MQPKRDERKTRHESITIRHTTPSRSEIVILVVQMQDFMGNWMVPIITYDGPGIAMMESGQFAHDIGLGLLIASYYYDLMMLDVMKPHE